MPATGPPLALIEPMAGRSGGHWQTAVGRLVRAAEDGGVPTVLIALGGVTDHLRQCVEVAGGSVIVRPAAADPRGWVLLLTGRALGFLGRLSRRTPRWGVPYQWTVASRALTEAAALRVAARWARPSAPVAIVLTAAETLPGAVVRLSGVDHVRIVHEVEVWEGPVLSRLERPLAGERRRVRAVCTTTSVREDLLRAHPDLDATVQVFTLDLPDARISNPEREAARAMLDLDPEAFVAAFVGGWWKSKDVHALADAMERVEGPVHLLVAGHPLSADVVERVRTSLGPRLHVVERSLSDDEVRAIYAASDVSVVSRHPRVAKESGLVMDAVRLGVPLLVSDHDPVLTALLEGRPWVRTFTAGDGSSLAAALDALVVRPIPPPGADEAHALGMLRPDAMVAFLRDLPGRAR